MVKNLRQYLWIGAFAVASVLAIPAAAQQYPQERQDQVRHDQDDQNRQYPDRDRDREGDRARDNDRDRAYDNGAYDNRQWVNSKAYKQGLKDGEHDRAKNKGERADHRHWKNDQDRQAYQAGYGAGYRGNPRYNHRNDHDRDDQRR